MYLSYLLHYAVSLRVEVSFTWCPFLYPVEAHTRYYKISVEEGSEFCYSHFSASALNRTHKSQHFPFVRKPINTANHPFSFKNSISSGKTSFISVF